jgi:hypothetical protein
VLDGALSCAVDGSVIGEGDGVGELVGVGVGLGLDVGDEVGEGVGDAAAFGWVAHAVMRTTRRSRARMVKASHNRSCERGSHLFL